MLALVRFLARVGADVYGQRAPLDEALSTSRCCAGVWSLVGVNAVVSLQVRFAVEALERKKRQRHVSRCGFLGEDHIGQARGGVPCRKTASRTERGEPLAHCRRVP